MSFTDKSPCGRPRSAACWSLAIWSRPANSWVNVIRCDHRIFGRPVWDQLFFRRVPREAPKPRSRPPSIGTFHRPACDRFRRPSPHRRCPPSRRKMRPSHFRPACLGPIIFSAGPREAPKPRSRRPSVGTFHRPACGRFRRPIPANRALTQIHDSPRPDRRPSVAPIPL